MNKEIRITEVENGFIVNENTHGMGTVGKQWVFNASTKLAEFIDEHYADKPDDTEVSE